MMTFREVFEEAVKRCEPRIGYTEAKNEFAKRVKEVMVEQNNDMTFVHVNVPYNKGEFMSINAYTEGIMIGIGNLQVKFKKVGTKPSRYSSYFNEPTTQYVAVFAGFYDDELNDSNFEEVVYNKIENNSIVLADRDARMEANNFIEENAELVERFNSVYNEVIEAITPYKKEYNTVRDEVYSNKRNFNDPLYRKTTLIMYILAETFHLNNLNI